MPRIRRSFIQQLVRNYPEANVGADARRKGDLTFEEAMMEVIKSLSLAKAELQRRLDCVSSPKHDESSVDP